MSNPIITRYKLPLLIGLVIGLAVIVLSDEVSPINAILAFVGSILGFLLIDSEYLIHAYIVDPSSEIALHIKEYFHSHNYRGLVDFYNNNEYNFGELSIRSVMFQVALSFLALMTITNNSWIFARTVVLTMAATLFYFQAREYGKTGTLQRWFWIYKGELSGGFYKIYMLIILLIFVYQFRFL